MCYINDNGETVVKGVVIDERVFSEELSLYRLEEREEIINNLIGWIGEGNKDKELMKDDLKYLMDLNDEYLFSSISTNEYIAKSVDEESFETIAEELIKLNEELKKWSITCIRYIGCYVLMTCVK